MVPRTYRERRVMYSLCLAGAVAGLALLPFGSRPADASNVWLILGLIVFNLVVWALDARLDRRG